MTTTKLILVLLANSFFLAWSIGSSNGEDGLCICKQETRSRKGPDASIDILSIVNIRDEERGDAVIDQQTFGILNGRSGPVQCYSPSLLETLSSQKHQVCSEQECVCQVGKKKGKAKKKGKVRGGHHEDCCQWLKVGRDVSSCDAVMRLEVDHECTCHDDCECSECLDCDECPRLEDFL